MDNAILKRFDGIEPLIGNTPLLEIHFKYKGAPRRVFAKAEWYNMTGNIKDRVAFYILKRAYETGAITRGDVIVEATSGNTGISFSAIGRYLGHRVVIYMPDWMSAERINLMRSFGADVRLVSKEDGGFIGSIERTEELYKKGGVYLPRQFSNEINSEAHYNLTGVEIANQLAALSLKADALVAGVGTGGTVMGVGKRLREINPLCRAHPLEPRNSPTLSTGHKVGKHRIQGISDEFIPPIVHLDELDHVIAVDDSDSITMAQMLSRDLGLGIGVSSGANFLGCVMAQNEIGGDSIVVTTFADDNKKYLSTDYSEPQYPKAGDITNDIELLGVSVYR
jgi:cysteine synthase A